MTLVLLRGLPGSGKSTLAQALAPRLRAVVLNKDIARDALFPGDTTEYLTAQDDVVIEAILLAARWHLAKRTVILDGRTHGRLTQVERVRQFCDEAGARLVIVECEVPVEVAISRVEAGTAHPAKNRNRALVERQAAIWEPLPYPSLKVDMAGLLDLAVSAVLKRVGPSDLPA